MSDLQPVLVAHLFPRLHGKLMELLASLSADEWSKQALPRWNVKDVVAHLLDGDLRRLSILRDGFWGEGFQGGSYQQLVAFLNRLNADWVAACKRLSPQVLIQLLELTGPQVARLHQSLDPFQPALLPVAWAGEDRSLNWFDIAREYTEKWHHQQQIREAVGRPGIMERELYFPVLDTFMRALPHGYRQVEAPVGSDLKVCVAGDAGGCWYLCRTHAGWKLAAESLGEVRAEAVIPQEIAWRLFTRGLDEQAARERIQVTGDATLTRNLTRVLAVMA